MPQVDYYGVLEDYALADYPTIFLPCAIVVETQDCMPCSDKTLHPVGIVEMVL
jgi:hypothetical protein